MYRQFSILCTTNSPFYVPPILHYMYVHSYISSSTDDVTSPRCVLQMFSMCISNTVFHKSPFAYFLYHQTSTICTASRPLRVPLYVQFFHNPSVPSQPKQYFIKSLIFCMFLYLLRLFYFYFFCFTAFTFECNFAI